MTCGFANTRVVRFASKVSFATSAMSPNDAMERRRWESKLGAAPVFFTRSWCVTGVSDEASVVKISRSMPMSARAHWRALVLSVDS
jgi:hypothetical protein